MSLQQIRAEYKRLRKTVVTFNEEVAKNINKLGVPSRKSTESSKCSGKVHFIQQRQIQNNNVTLLMLQKDYEQLQRRVSMVQIFSKEQIDMRSNQIKHRMKKLKNRIKELKMRSKHAAELIVKNNTGEDELRSIDEELKVQQSRRYKFIQDNEDTVHNLNKLNEQLQEIRPLYYKVEQYFLQKNEKHKMDTDDNAIASAFSHKKYHLEVITKKTNSMFQTKQQKYHGLLKELEQKTQKGEQLSQKLQHTYQMIQSRQNTVAQLEKILSQVMINKLQKNNEQQAPNEQSLFFTEIEPKKDSIKDKKRNKCYLNKQKEQYQKRIQFIQVRKEQIPGQNKKYIKASHHTSPSNIEIKNMTMKQQNIFNHQEIKDGYKSTGNSKIVIRKNSNNQDKKQFENVRMKERVNQSLPNINEPRQSERRQIQMEFPIEKINKEQEEKEQKSYINSQDNEKFNSEVMEEDMGEQEEEGEEEEGKKNNGEYETFKEEQEGQQLNEQKLNKIQNTDGIFEKIISQNQTKQQANNKDEDQMDFQHQIQQTKCNIGKKIKIDADLTTIQETINKVNSCKNNHQSLFDNSLQEFKQDD